MEPYANELLPRADITLWRRSKRLVQQIPDKLALGVDHTNKAVILSCHIVARAVGEVLGLEYTDGYFHPNFQHSWLRTPTGNMIDAYPVGILGGPLLVAKFVGTRLYTERNDIFEGRFEQEWHNNAVAIVKSFLSEKYYRRRELDPTLQTQAVEDGFADGRNNKTKDPPYIYYEEYLKGFFDGSRAYYKEKFGEE